MVHEPSARSPRPLSLLLGQQPEPNLGIKPFTYLWLVGNGGMGHNYNYYYYYNYYNYYDQVRSACSCTSHFVELVSFILHKPSRGHARGSEYGELSCNEDLRGSTCDAMN